MTGVMGMVMGFSWVQVVCCGLIPTVGYPWGVMVDLVFIYLLVLNSLKNDHWMFAH